jgi:uncharacterized protein (UPF0305 family)
MKLKNCKFLYTINNIKDAVFQFIKIDNSDKELKYFFNNRHDDIKKQYNNDCQSIIAYIPVCVRINAYASYIYKS